MTDKVETVTVVRKDHPDGKVDINKSDLTKDDVIYGEKPKPYTKQVKK